MKNIFGKFYQKTLEERKDILNSLGLFDNDLDYIASSDLFSHMIENVVTTYELPMGVVPDYLINHKTYVVPLVTEEPSVVAASSHAAKIIARNGGFKSFVLNREMIGQIIFKITEHQEQFMHSIQKDYDHILQIGKNAHPHIAALGGGITAFEMIKKSDTFICLYAYIDPVDAMGANTVNTILESIATYIETTYKQDIVMSILSNLATRSLVEATCVIDPKTLKHSENVATRIADASFYATMDPYRAATHNKGIMNGISALVLATGNDTRAIEASNHAFAAFSGSYQPLATWHVLPNGNLEGRIKLPMPVGIVGGSMKLLPKAKLAYKILNIGSAKELMQVAACVGLASNFAALYALTTEGIQKGHMRLHARTIALEAGTPLDKLNDVVHHLIETGEFSVDNAKRFLNLK